MPAKKPVAGRGAGARRSTSRRSGAATQRDATGRKRTPKATRGRPDREASAVGRQAEVRADVREAVEDWLRDRTGALVATLSPLLEVRIAEADRRHRRELIALQDELQGRVRELERALTDAERAGERRLQEALTMAEREHRAEVEALRGARDDAERTARERRRRTDRAARARAAAGRRALEVRLEERDAELRQLRREHAELLARLREEHALELAAKDEEIRALEKARRNLRQVLGRVDAAVDGEQPERRRRAPRA